MKCNSCEVLYINGIKCHEQGCPDAWRDEVRECKWCGQKFVPENRFQEFCSLSCFSCFSGLDEETIHADY